MFDTAHDAPLSLLGGRARLIFRGRACGSASLRDLQAPARILAGAALLGSEDLVGPWLEFVHAVCDERDLAPLPALHGTVRFATRVGDGFLLRTPGRAVYLANADCALGVMCAGERAVVMHLGLACLYRDDEGPVLMAQALEALGAPPGEVAFWVGCGAGPCCLAYDHGEPAHVARGQMLQRRFGADVVTRGATRGPRAGQPGYDHVLMAARQAELLGIATIEAERTCTSCHGVAPGEDPAMGTYFSNVRDLERRRERNLILVALGR